jgi:hypothetical protein
MTKSYIDVLKNSEDNRKEEKYLPQKTNLPYKDRTRRLSHQDGITQSCTNVLSLAIVTLAVVLVLKKYIVEKM